MAMGKVTGNLYPEQVSHAPYVVELAVGRGESAISGGKVFSTIYDLLSEKGSENTLMKAVQSDGETPQIRKHLPGGVAASAIMQTGKTFAEILQLAFPNKQILTDTEKEFIEMLESIGPKHLKNVLDIIREAQKPWWLNFVDNNDIDLNQKFYALYTIRTNVVRVGRVEKETLEKKYPVTLSLGKISAVYNVDTDILADVSNELDAPISYLSRLPMEKVPFYTYNKTVDRIFIEYKLLAPELRKIPFHYLKTVKGGARK